MTLQMNSHLKDDAVSTVIGGILILGLVAIMMVLVQTTWVPVWEEGDEAQHMELVSRQMSDMRRESHRLTSEGGQATMPITPGIIEGGGFFDKPKLPGNVHLFPADIGVAIDAPQLRLHASAGGSIQGHQASYAPVASGLQETGLHDIDHFQVRVVDPSASVGGSSRLSFFDAANALHATLDVDLIDSGDGYRIQATTTAATGGDPVGRLSSYYDDGDDPGQHLINVLDDDLGLAGILGAMSEPISVTFTETAMELEYALGSWIVDGQGGRVRDAVGGHVVNDFSRNYIGGSLAFFSGNQYFPAQDYILQGGGVILRQGTDETFRFAPAWEVTLIGDVLRIDTSIPVFHGTPNAFSTPNTVSVDMAASSQQTIEGSAPRTIWNVTTSFPQAWADHWQVEMEGLGFTDGDEYVLTSGATWAQLDLRGPETDPSDLTEHDLYLVLRQADINLRMGP